MKIKYKLMCCSLPMAPICLSDNLSHKLGLHWDWLCNFHDYLITRGFTDLTDESIWEKPTAGKIRSAEGKYPPEELEKWCKDDSTDA